MHLALPPEAAGIRHVTAALSNHQGGCCSALRVVKISIISPPLGGRSHEEVAEWGSTCDHARLLALLQATPLRISRCYRKKSMQTLGRMHRIEDLIREGYEQNRQVSVSTQ